MARTDSYFPPTDDLSPRESPLPPLPYSKEDDASKIQVFLRNSGRWENIHGPFESSPPRVPPRPRDRAARETPHSAIVDPNDDASRCSLLIHEVSLLVGLAPDDLYPSPDDTCPLVSDRSNQVPDILPLTLTPTKSLASRKRTNIGLPPTLDTNVQNHPATTPIFPNITPRSDRSTPILHSDEALPVPVTPTPRHKNDSVRPSLSPRRRHGQVFHREPPLIDAPRRNVAVLDETFIHPREPPPKPILDSPPNRCSSLDRLERSLLKLEAHAPRNHRKSYSEERSSIYAAQRMDKRPSLPPPRRLKKEHSSHDIRYRNPSLPTHGRRLSDPPPVPTPIPVRQHVAPPISPASPIDEELTPTSFMDMDIPWMQETSQKRQASFRQLTGRAKMKSLVRAAKTASRGVIAWGKNLTGSTKPSVAGLETTAIQNTHV